MPYRARSGSIGCRLRYRGSLPPGDAGTRWTLASRRCSAWFASRARDAGGSSQDSSGPAPVRSSARRTEAAAPCASAPLRRLRPGNRIGLVLSVPGSRHAPHRAELRAEAMRLGHVGDVRRRRARLWTSPSAHRAASFIGSRCRRGRPLHRALMIVESTILQRLPSTLIVAHELREDRRLSGNPRGPSSRVVGTARRPALPAAGLAGRRPPALRVARCAVAQPGTSLSMRSMSAASVTSARTRRCAAWGAPLRVAPHEARGEL